MVSSAINIGRFARVSSLRAVCEHESMYVNASGYWAAFHESAIDLRQESIEGGKESSLCVLYDVWALISVRFTFLVLGWRTEFYKISAEYPTYAKMVLPSLEHRGDLVASNDLTEPLETLQSHMTTQLMKVVATINSSNTTKRVKVRGGPADGQ